MIIEIRQLDVALSSAEKRLSPSVSLFKKTLYISTANDARISKNVYIIKKIKREGFPSPVLIS